MSEQNVNIHYGPGDAIGDSYVLTPSPKINISYEPIYANDTVIGTVNKITLTGYVSAYRKNVSFGIQNLNSENFTIQSEEALNISTEDDNNIVTSEDDGIIIINNGDITDGNWTVQNEGAQKANNIRLITKEIDNLEKILLSNGNNLIIRDTNQNIVVKAVGGVIKSLQFENGNNVWTQVAPYTAELEFNYISLLGEDLTCSAEMSGSLVDLDKYAIKSFSDQWSIDINDESFYNIATSGSNQLNIANNIIALSYNISAAGKDYYDKNNSNAIPKLKPAWETAKHFVQNRLYDQVVGILSGILPTSSGDGCISSAGGSGLLSQLNAQYQIFNEKIQCSVSENEGTFSATYNSLLKKKSDSNQTYDSDYAKHSINKSINYNHNDNLATISINGSIEGLILGGLINYDKSGFKLPNNGSLLIGSYSGTNKYTHAENLLDRIMSNDDLTENFKSALNITYSGLYASGCNNSTPPASQFNIVKNIINGTIEYTAEYSSKIILTNVGRTESIQSITIDYADSTPVFAEFPTLSGVVLQDIDTITSKEISFNITGRNDNYKIITPFTTFPSSFIITTASTPIEIPSLIENNFPDYSGYVIKNRSQNINMMDGTYSIQLTYSCSSGCLIL